MAYFAKIIDNIVVNVISISNNDAPDPAPFNSEALGQAFISNILLLYGIWKQTSYNGNFRKNYAGIGYYYDEQRDAFIPPKPFPSWILNEDTCLWNSPVPYPNDGKIYKWNENILNWEEINF